jgi:hypothetical protein
MRLGGTKIRSGWFGPTENILFLPKFEPQPIEAVATHYRLVCECTFVLHILICCDGMAVFQHNITIPILFIGDELSGVTALKILQIEFKI